MDNINKTGGLWNVAISLGGAAMATGLALATGSTTALAVAWFLGLGFLVSLARLLHMHLAVRDGLEDLPVNALQTGGSGEAVCHAVDAVAAVRPSAFQWPLFLLGFSVMSWAGLRITWPGRSRLLRT